MLVWLLLRKYAVADEMKHCIIFGGSRGIGLAVYKHFAANSYNITVASRSTQNLQTFFETASKTPSFGRPLALPCDVREEESVLRTVKICQEWFGPADVLVNAAGVNKDSLLLKTKLSDIQDVLSTNLVGSMLTSKAVLKSMLARKQGCIINIGSVVGLHGNVGQCAYSASKAGLVGFTKSLAKEVGSRGIRVNLVAPGFVETDMTSNLSKSSQEMISSLPIPRMGQPNEVAEVVKFLADNQYITGHVFYVDGGLHLTM